MTTHVPAWKRLGLQLKSSASQNVQEEIPNSVVKQNSVVQPPRKLQDITKGGPKKIAAVLQSAVGDPGSDTTVVEHHKRKSHSNDPHASNAQQTVKKRKSVSFDVDEPEQLADAKSISIPPSTSVPNTSPAELDTRPKKKQKTKSKQAVTGTTNSKVSKSTAQTKEAFSKVQKPYLHYLEQYSQDRPSWKFNKNHQNKLFDNMFNLTRIPTKYDAPLLGYVQGLQGAAARSRIKADAERVIAERPSATLATNEGGDAAVRTAETTNGDALPDSFREQQVARAEAVVAALASSESNALPAAATAARVQRATPSEEKLNVDNVPKAEPQQSKRTGRSRGRSRRTTKDVSSDSDDSSIVSSSSDGE